MKRWGVLGALALVLAACAGGANTGAGGTVSTGSPAAGTPSFKLAVAPILEAKCAACHSQGGQRRPYFLDAQGKTSQALFQPEAREALGEITRKKMPPAGSPALSADEIAVVQAWVNAGSPDN